LQTLTEYIQLCKNNRNFPEVGCQPTFFLLLMYKIRIVLVKLTILFRKEHETMKKTVNVLLSLVMVFALGFTMLMPVCAATGAEEEAKAEALKSLGLFKGVSDTDFALDRAPTRTEALVMLIRSLGKESEALGGDWSHPFTDVDAWADKYVGYGYEKGLTKGVSAVEFGTGNADSDMYLTFMLRALGYDDSLGDFKWNAPDVLAKTVGILPASVDTSNFLRSDVVMVSWAALEASLKAGMQSMNEKLITENVFSSDTYAQTVAQVGMEEVASVSVSSFEELKSALADSQVKSISIHSIGTPIVVTNNLTIPASVTVTVNRGSDLYIEGTLTNNGTIIVEGADSVSADFINYSVLSIQAGGILNNKGQIYLEPAVLTDTDDRGPVGGQLRVNGGTLNNEGSLLLERGFVNTHGGMSVVIDGTFTNDGYVIVDGFFFRVDEGSFVNNPGGVVINNTNIIAEGEGTFINNGVISGAEVQQ